MAQPIDLLVLAVSRVKKGVALAGMTTEPDPVTGRVWVEIARSDGPLQLSDITLPDGALIRPGDVVRWEGLQANPQPPYVEQWVITDETERKLLRHITPERYARFFPEHLDRDPQAVLERHERSLCLVQAHQTHAMFEREDKRFKSYMLFDLPDLGSFDETPVTDIAWRALGQEWLTSEELPEIAFDPEDIQARFGAVYLVLGLQRNKTVLVRGVHTIPAYAARIDPAHL
ncbi:MAG: hypothetical protein H0T53_14860 [Herpetosiphonaceae bacterium]|nr:hypothetical protein [Herpetosiphonaceae bacterium]